MEFIFILIFIGSVIFQIYKKFQEESEKNGAPKPPGYGQYTPDRPQQTEYEESETSARKQEPTSIEEALEEMIRQAKKRKETAEQQFEVQEPDRKPELSALGRPVESIEYSTSRIDTPKGSTEPGKGYTFSDSLATSTLTEKTKKEQDKGILREKQATGIRRRKRRSAFPGSITPRQAFKYSILFERKYS